MHCYFYRTYLFTPKGRRHFRRARKAVVLQRDCILSLCDFNAVATWQRGKIFDEDVGRYIEYSTDTVTPLRVSAAARYRPIERLHLSLQAAYHGAADYYSPSEQSLGFINTDAVFLMDASAGYEIGSGRLYLAASNLLDERYVNVANQGLGDFFYYRAEGRRLTVGYKARF